MGTNKAIKSIFWAIFSCSVQVCCGETILAHFYTTSSSVLDHFHSSNEFNARVATHSFLLDAIPHIQMPLIKWLSSKNHFAYESLWVTNSVIVYNASQELIDEINCTFSYLLEVEMDGNDVFLLPYQVTSSSVGLLSSVYVNEFFQAQSNIKTVHAPELWDRQIQGQGVVIASIDSGVRYTHESLASSYRGFLTKSIVNHDYSFWITKSQNKTLTPDNADPVGHGTHTMGTAVGKLGIGVAPKATWITARPFDWDGSALKSDLLLAAQWVMCPTKWNGKDKDCSYGANIVSNSFGGNSTTRWMHDIVKTWSTAGILPVFASGNVNGFQCGTILCPGCSIEAVAVGALIGGASLWGGSGKGPSIDHVIKPDYVAPGVAIRSALSTADSKYTRLTGTSMATPHVSGLAALLFQMLKTKHVNVGDRELMKKLRQIMSSTCFEQLKKPFLVPSKCGNTSYDQYPNNIYGFGLPNGCDAAQKIGIQCKPNSIHHVATNSVENF